MRNYWHVFTGVKCPGSVVSTWQHETAFDNAKDAELEARDYRDSGMRTRVVRAPDHHYAWAELNIQLGLEAQRKAIKIARARELV